MKPSADPDPASSSEARAQLQALVRGYRIPPAIYVATRLGIPDLLADGPKDVDALARACGAHAPSLGRLLSALTAVGVFDKVGPGRFALAAMGQALRRDVPGSMRNSILFLLNETHWRPWGHMLHTVRTGETAFDHAHGAGLFDYMANHPEVSALFNAGMAGNSPAHACLVADAYDYSGAKLVVDVGAGRGRLIATILARNPHLRGILFDQPHVIDGARETLAEAGVDDRCDLAGGSFFESVPADGDVYVLRNIIHDWKDEEAIAILATCRRAMKPNARLLLVERELPDDPRQALMVHHADLEMLVNVGGQERTTEEYAALLERSGLRLARTLPLPPGPDAMGHYIVEAEPA